ncbi:CLUMA_CG018996, isoform A [Clunio marinus]|uniref:CLUMA_CG018996, isoform A n=1 Tax=Clunio marinus TaxID=568069 RepID=A0A1J1J1G7_9DIPT|nr:CLUMA_CG018996, isoform A [Clunio marinus]
MKYSRNPSGRSNETKFGEMTSSSFEHVNVMGMYENRFSDNDLRVNDDDYVQSLRLAAARMRPLPAPPSINNQQLQRNNS